MKSIPVKLNSTTVIIDDRVKATLLNQFEVAKLNFEKENSFDSNLNGSSNQIVDRKSSTGISTEIKEKKKKDAKDRIMTGDWSLVQFHDGSITYENKRFIHSKSKNYLNHLKAYFYNKSYTYEVCKTNGEVTSIEIPEYIFKLARLGKQVNDILTISHSTESINLKFNFQEYGLSYHDIFSVFGKKKTFYLEYLFVHHLQNSEIVCIPEPIFQNGDLVRRDLSFIFHLGDPSHPTIIWESVEPNKASYLFQIDHANYSLDEVLKTIETFLLLEEPYKRKILQSSSDKLIEGVVLITSIRHDYCLNKDLVWVNNVKSKIKNGDDMYASP